MTTVYAIMARLEAAGVRLRTDGDWLIANPREKVTPYLADLIRDHRDDLLRELRAVPAEIAAVFPWAVRVEAMTTVLEEQSVLERSGP